MADIDPKNSDPKNSDPKNLDPKNLFFTQTDLDLQQAIKFTENALHGVETRGFQPVIVKGKRFRQRIFQI